LINEKVAKNALWNSIGMLVYFACQWLVTVAVVRLSDDFANAGNLSLAMNISNVLFVLAAYNNRYFQVSDINNEYNDSEYLVSRMLTCTGAVLLCVVFIFIENFSAMQRLIILCYMLFRANEAFIDVFYGIDQKNWRMDYIGLSMVIRGVSMLVAFTLLVWQLDLLSAIIGITATSLIINFLFDIQKTKKLASFTAFAGKKIFSLLKRCFPLMLVLLICTVIVSFARYMIERIHGEEALGIFASATSPTLVINVSASLLFAPLVNLLAESLKKGDKGRFFRLFTASFAIIAGITIIFTAASYFFGEWILKIIYGDKSDLIVPHVYLMTGAAVAAGFTALLWFLNVVFSAMRDINGIFVCLLIGMVICFAAAGMMLNIYGLQGANYVMIISQGAAALCVFARLLWVTKKKPDLFAKQ
jgi:O-antigen/teichoic acid export membrane protein